MWCLTSITFKDKQILPHKLACFTCYGPYTFLCLLFRWNTDTVWKGNILFVIALHLHHKDTFESSSTVLALLSQDAHIMAQDCRDAEEK